MFAFVCLFFLISNAYKAQNAEKNYIVGTWKVTSLSLDGEHDYDIEIFASRGYDVAGDLEVDESSFTMTFSNKVETGMWKEYENKDDSVVYILPINGTDVFSVVNKDNTKTMYMYMNLGNDEKMYFTYQRVDE